MKGLKAKNVSPALLSVGQQVSRIVQDDYPGYAKRFVVIRAPAIFQLAYNALKFFIDDEFKQKITVSGGNNYQKLLKRYMDPTVLPPELHPEGKGEAVDDFQAIWKGGPIPEEDIDDEEYIVLRAAAVQHVRDIAVEFDTENNTADNLSTCRYNVGLEEVFAEQKDDDKIFFKVHQLANQVRDWILAQPGNFVKAFGQSMCCVHDNPGCHPPPPRQYYWCI